LRGGKGKRRGREGKGRGGEREGREERKKSWRRHCVDMSRGDNVQGILGAISPFWGKWGLGRVCGNPEDLSATSQRPIFTTFGHET